MSELRPSIVLTGASGDIGLAICRKFVEAGYFVFAQGHKHMETLGEFSALDVCAMQVDLSSEEEIGNFVKQMDKTVSGGNGIMYPTIFIHSAGISHLGLLQDVSVEEWDKVFNINVRSANSITQKLLPWMFQAEGGSILFISSFWGELGASCEALYSASKGALNALTKSFAKELGPSNIRVNALALGAIDTKMNAWMSQEEKEALCDTIALGRMGTVDEVAEAALFFASDKASYFTGQIIRMDGQYLGA